MRMGWIVVAGIVIAGAAWSQSPIVKTGDVLTLKPEQLARADLGQLVDDAASPSGKAVASSGKAWYLIHTVSPELPAGRYQVTVKMLVGKRDAPHSVGVFSVNSAALPPGEDVNRRFTVEDFEKAGQYRDFSVDVMLPPEKEGKGRLLVKVLHEYVAVPVRLASVDIRALAIGPLLVSRVWPEKLLCRCNTDQSFTVGVHNLTAQPQSGLKLKLELVSGLNVRLPIGEKDVSLQPFESTNQVFSWKTGEQEYGYEVKAVLVDGQGNAAGEASDVFAVTRSHFKMRIGIAAGPYFIDPASVTNAVKQCRKSYANYLEVYGWGPGSFVELYPRQRFWSSGQVCEWVYDRDVMKAWTAEMHRQGLWATAYNISLFNGWPGQEYMRKHPEWCGFNKLGRPSGSINTTYWQTKEMAYGDDKPPKGFPFNGEMPNSGILFVANDDLMKHGANEIVMINRELGFDGVRWDGHPVIWCEEEDSESKTGVIGTGLGETIYNYEGKTIFQVVGKGKRDKASLHNMQLIKDILRKAAPEFEWGYNMGYDLTAETMPLTWKECVAGAGVWVEGGFRSGDEGRADPSNTWEKYIEKLYLSSQFVLRNGGYPIHGALSADTTIVLRYQYALHLAHGAHPCINTLPYVLDGYSRFATRYCQYLFDPRIHPWWGYPDIHVTGWVQWEDRKAKTVPPVGEAVRIQSTRPVWFEKTVFCRDVSEKEHETIVHLMNDPGKPYIDYIQMDSPPAQEGIVVSVKAPAGAKLKEVRCLSPDLPTMEQALTGDSSEPGWIKVTVPRLELWDILVFQWEGGQS